jgi:quercetin dioxygenase-like cupin family protein
MRTLVTTMTLGLAATSMFATGTTRSDGVDVIPDTEKEIARDLGVSGPAETRGIASSISLGLVDLGGDFAALKNRSLRARRVTVSPGGVVGVHRHTSRPGVLYVLEGELTEFRNDHEGELIRRKGDTSFEKEGVVHWWRNDSGADAIAFVVDIVPSDMQ